MIKENILIWDLETSGLGPDAKILEIGAIYINSERANYQWYLNHNVEIPAKATEVNGITKEMIDEKGIKPEIALGEFVALLNKCDKHITHNGFNFDIPFLVAECKEVLKWSDETAHFFEKWLRATACDTAVKVKADKLGRVQDIAYPRFAREIMNQRVLGLKYNLKDTIKEYGLEYKNAHSALGDIEMTYQVYLKQNEKN